MFGKYFRKIHNENLASAMDRLYKKLLEDQQYQELNQKWGHQPLQFNLETPFEREYRQKFFEDFKGSILEIGSGLTPLQTKNTYTGIDIATIPAKQFPNTKTADFLTYPIDKADLLYSQDCLMPKMAKKLKIPHQAFIICNGVEGIDKWIKKLRFDEVIVIEDFLDQVQKMHNILSANDCDQWIKVTRLREFESILRMKLKRVILIKK